MSHPPAILLMGPTASGKTDLAVALSQRFPIEIISVDSALVYRDMDIGTAKPDAATLAAAPHHLIDIIDPTEAYSAAAFCQDALTLMHDIVQRGKIPLLVGGTMLYFKALREGLSDLPQADAALRAKLDAQIAEFGITQLHQQLAQIDPETAARLKSTDTQRIQRAMEIYHLTGQPMSTLLAKQQPYELPFRVVPLALIPSERSVLHQRIAQRFHNMLKLGLIDELHSLRARYPLHADLPSMRCVGYRQAWQFVEGEINQEAMIETGIVATRQLAKRQLTWLRSMSDVMPLDCLNQQVAQQANQLIERHLISQ